MPTILEIREKRANLTKNARDILDRAEKDKRGLSAEETSQWDKIFAEVDQLGDEIARREQLEKAEAALAASAGRRTEHNPLERADNPPDRRRRLNPTQERRSSENYQEAFRAFLLGGVAELQSRRAEFRDLQADSDIAGGYMVAPQQFLERIIIFMNNFVFMRKICHREEVTSAQSLGVPSLDTDINDADWTSELATGNDDTAMAIGKRELYPHPLAKRILVSNKLLRLAPNTENLVEARMGYKFGVAEEKAFMTGTGSQQPLGIFTASANGVPTSQDVTSSVSANFNADDLITLKYNLKVQHQAAGVFFLHRTITQKVRQLKDGDGQYIWQPGLKGTGLDPKTGMVTDTLLDRPLYMSEYAPSTLSSGSYIAMFFNPEFYWIADAQEFEIQRLVELYAQTNQTGFIGRMALDGMPVLAEAFSRLKCL